MYGEKLKQLRGLEGWTQEEVARKLGVSKQTYSHYENEKRKPGLDTIKELASIYQVNIDNIFSEHGNIKNIKLPLVGIICAGDGLLAEQNIEDHIYYPMPGNSQPDYALRVSGDSMIGAGIDDGDIVYLKKSSWAEYNGQIVAALINDQEEGTLKKMKWSEGSNMISLIPANDDYDPIYVLPNEVTICGVYKGHFKPEKL